jgi:hypothetical protein
MKLTGTALTLAGLALAQRVAAAKAVDQEGAESRSTEEAGANLNCQSRQLRAPRVDSHPGTAGNPHDNFSQRCW